MNEKKHKKSFLSSGCGGGFAGFMLWVALNKIGVVGESTAWWKGLVLMFICTAIGVAFQAMDEQRKESDIVIKKNKIQDENENSK